MQSRLPHSSKQIPLCFRQAIRFVQVGNNLLFPGQCKGNTDNGSHTRSMILGFGIGVRSVHSLEQGSLPPEIELREPRKLWTRQKAANFRSLGVAEGTEKRGSLHIQDKHRLFPGAGGSKEIPVFSSDSGPTEGAGEAVSLFRKVGTGRSRAPWVRSGAGGLWEMPEFSGRFRGLFCSRCRP